MTTEDEIRRVLHPEAYEPMRYDPRPRIPLGCDQQGRYPEAADPRIDDEIRDPEPPQRDPWWPQVLGAVCALLALALIFAPLGR